jgi:hypothetical protein
MKSAVQNRLPRPVAPAFLAAALLALWQTAALAAPVTIATPFINLESRKANSLGFTAGDFMRIGAISVIPNGSAGTTGLGTHRLPNGSLTTRDINFIPSPLNPNFFQRNFADDPTLRGDWTLTFTNGPDSASRNVTLAAGAQYAPYVNNITLSGTSLNPTFTWTPPAGATVNGYRINIYDKALITPGSSGQVTNRDVAPGVTSYTVNAADFSVPGNAFTVGKNYGIEISVIQTKDGTGNTSNANIQAIARTYADFSPREGGGPVVHLPVIAANGSYVFDLSVVPGQTYYIDPDVAIGYDYEIGAGNPNFASVLLPAGIGDDLFDILGFDNAGLAVLLAEDWQAGRVFNFGGNGIERFRVTGIETSAMLDPGNTTAFVTGVTFAGAGSFTGTQTPLTVFVPSAVPEPSALALVALALFSLRATRTRSTAG